MTNGSDDSPLQRVLSSLKAPERSLAAMVPSDAFITKVVGSKNGGNVRNSESLDYEPMQNKIFYDRIKHAKESKKKLYGCAPPRRGLLAARRRRHAPADRCPSPRRSYTGQTLAKFMVTLFTGVITGIFAHSSTCMNILICITTLKSY